jgi:hypothetical protein
MTKTRVGSQMRRCSAIKPNGERCQRPAEGPHGLCWAHAPENAEKRRRTASRAAKAKPNKEVALLKEELKALKDDVLDGRVDRNVAAVVVQVYRTLKDFIELERRVKETDELAAEIEDLKREYGVA